MVRGVTFITIAALCSIAAATSGCVYADLPGEATQTAGRSDSAGVNYEATSYSAKGDNAVTAGDGAKNNDTTIDFGSRCTASDTSVSCPFLQQSVPGSSRNVIWQVPVGKPPADGWPVVILFPGALYGPSVIFEGSASDPLGRYYAALTVKALLDAGYAVLAPEADAPFGGVTMWDTNIPPWSFFYTYSPDYAFMQSFFKTIPAGSYGPLDVSRMYAAGMSSGGYMTSRMAVSYPGMFRALAVHSASYATCNGAFCLIPDKLPSDHPPTLFLHGEKDLIVPIDTMKAYDARLVAEGKETRVVTDPTAQHQWIAAAPGEVVAWFDAHP